MYCDVVTAGTDFKFRGQDISPLKLDPGFVIVVLRTTDVVAFTC